MLGSLFVVEDDAIQSLIDTLGSLDFDVYGPTVRDGAIVIDRVDGTADLPIGQSDCQNAGQYRLQPRDDGAFFGYVNGAESWKRLLYPPAERLWSAHKDGEGITFETPDPSVPKLALLGVRSCDLEAIKILDRIFCGGANANALYQQRRAGAFIIAVNCTKPGGTCFCVSMGEGPKSEGGFDLALTERINGDHHDFIVEVGTTDGAEVMEAIRCRTARGEDLAYVEDAMTQARASMGRRLDTQDLKEALEHSLDHPRWDVIADRCLTCGNCTMVCPTCFCSTITDRTSIDGETAERIRTWDSCFSLDFSYLHGGSVRTTGGSRYRQWITHKLAHWHDQFGVSGCVGCGRCITWCPVGIDITEEAAAMQAIFESNEVGANEGN